MRKMVRSSFIMPASSGWKASYRSGATQFIVLGAHPIGTSWRSSPSSWRSCRPAWNPASMRPPPIARSGNFPNGCHVCEVEIDPETGGTPMVGYWVVDDVGTVINPMLVKGQIMPPAHLLPGNSRALSRPSDG
jgi:CO/xanthine dehydrogenase Mo-binding subunit